MALVVLSISLGLIDRSSRNERIHFPDSIHLIRSTSHSYTSKALAKVATSLSSVGRRGVTREDSELLASDVDDLLRKTDALQTLSLP